MNSAKCWMRCSTARRMCWDRYALLRVCFHSFVDLIALRSVRQTNGDHWYLYMTDRKENQSIFSPSYRATTNSPTTTPITPSTAAAAAAASASASAAAKRKSDSIASTSPAAAAATNGHAPGALTLPPTTGSASLIAAADSVMSPSKKLKTDSSASASASAAATTRDHKSPALPSSSPRSESPSPSAFAAAANAESSVKGVSQSLFVKSAKKADQTLELLMTDLDQKKMKIFIKKKDVSAAQVTKVCARRPAPSCAPLLRCAVVLRCALLCSW
jgi:hypothetical protein